MSRSREIMVRGGRVKPVDSRKPGVVGKFLKGIGIFCLMVQVFGAAGRGGVDQARWIQVTVASEISWTDTGLEVREGEEITFRGEGGISLQRGNPMAYCGPDGYDLRTVQQPIRDKNIGALIGSVVQLISLEIDEKTGEEIRNELVEYFYIGSGNTVKMPLTGHLFLGVNENLVQDNEGKFSVEIRLQP